MTAVIAALEHAVAIAALLEQGELDGQGLILIDGRDAMIGGKTVTAAELLIEFETALAAARKLEGNRRPVLSEASMFARLETYVRTAGTAKAAAERLGIAQSFLCDIRNARRRAPDHVIAALGYRRVGRRREFEEL